MKNSVVVVRPAAMLQERDTVFIAGFDPFIAVITRIDKGEFITVFMRYPVKSATGEIKEFKEVSLDLSRFDSLQIIKEL